MAGDLRRNDGILKTGKSLQPQSTKILGTPFIPSCGDEETNVQMQISQGTLCQISFVCVHVYVPPHSRKDLRHLFYFMSFKFYNKCMRQILSLVFLKGKIEAQRVYMTGSNSKW